MFIIINYKIFFYGKKWIDPNKIFKRKLKYELHGSNIDDDDECFWMISIIADCVIVNVLNWAKKIDNQRMYDLCRYLLEVFLVFSSKDCYVRNKLCFPNYNNIFWKILLSIMSGTTFVIFGYGFLVLAYYMMNPRLFRAFYISTRLISSSQCL